jgi:rubredoxin
MNKSRDVHWICSECGASNVDYPNLTMLPMCSECGYVFHWDDLDNSESEESDQ